MSKESDALIKQMNAQVNEVLNRMYAGIEKKIYEDDSNTMAVKLNLKKYLIPKQQDSLINPHTGQPFQSDDFNAEDTLDLDFNLEDKLWKHGYCIECECELAPAMDGESGYCLKCYRNINE